MSSDEDATHVKREAKLIVAEVITAATIAALFGAAAMMAVV